MRRLDFFMIHTKTNNSPKNVSCHCMLNTINGKYDKIPSCRWSKYLNILNILSSSKKKILEGQSFCIFIGIHEICDNINRLLCKCSDKIPTIYVQKVASTLIVCNLISMKRCRWRFNLHKCVYCIVHIWKMQYASCKIALIWNTIFNNVFNIILQWKIIDRTM